VKKGKNKKEREQHIILDADASDLELDKSKLD
jgi:hypothetical protein